MEDKALLGDTSDLSSEDGLPSTHLPSLKRRQSWLGILALHTVLIIFCSVIFTAVFERYISSKENLGPGLIYSESPYRRQALNMLHVRVHHLPQLLQGL